MQKVAHPQGKAAKPLVALPSDSVAKKISAQLGVAQSRATTAVAVTQLSKEEFGFVNYLVGLTSAGVTLAQRRKLSIDLKEAVANLVKDRDRDLEPLKNVDEPMGTAESIELQVKSEQEITKTRTKLLMESISVDEASELVRRSRQNLERLLKNHKALALRVGKQWRYPKWQFDIDQPGGIVPGIAGVLQKLHLSPFGVALWLTMACSHLQGQRPIDLLRKGRVEDVLTVAEALGDMP